MNTKFVDPNIARTGDFIDLHLANRENWWGSVPPFAHLEFNIFGACNRKCSFCPKGDWKRYPNNSQGIDFDLFSKIMADLSEKNFSGRVSFSGFSEPFLHPKIKELVAVAKKVCPKSSVEIVTNGDFLNPRVLRELFEIGLDNIRISIYDGKEAMQRFEQMRENLGLPKEKMMMRRRYLENGDYGIVFSNRAGALPEAFLPKKKQLPLVQACHFPFFKMLIDFSGFVFLCSNDWKKELPIGDLNKENIFFIWENDPVMKVRKNLIESNRKFRPCQDCDVEGILNGKAHFERWSELMATGFRK